MKLTIFFLVVLSFIGVRCQNGPNDKPESKNTHNDTIVTELPEWYSTSNYLQRRDKRLRTLLNLESLRNGFDSLQIRIWIDCGYNISGLIVIESKRYQWSAAFYSFKIHYDENLNFEIQNLETESRSPKSGWKSFRENLMKTDIINLPDAIKFFPKYNFPTDANRVLVEIGVLKKYRLYEYPELGLNSSIAEGAGKLHQALNLIEREFNYKRPCQDSGNVSN